MTNTYCSESYNQPSFYNFRFLVFPPGAMHQLRDNATTSIKALILEVQERMLGQYGPLYTQVSGDVSHCQGSWISRALYLVVLV